MGSAQGAAVSEAAIGQYEINLKHESDALIAADHGVLLRRLIKGVATEVGLDPEQTVRDFLVQFPHDSTVGSPQALQDSDAADVRRRVGITALQSSTSPSTLRAARRRSRSP